MEVNTCETFGAQNSRLGIAAVKFAVSGFNRRKQGCFEAAVTTVLCVAGTEFRPAHKRSLEALIIKLHSVALMAETAVVQGPIAHRAHLLAALEWPFFDLPVHNVISHRVPIFAACCPTVCCKAHSTFLDVS